MTSRTPSVVLAAYAEPLLEGRRVLFLGDATTEVPEELVLRGARAVHVLDREPSRAAEAAAKNRSKQISVLPFDEADVAVRDGAFDLAIVANLASFRDPAAVLNRARRALGPRGTAIVAVPNPDAKLALVPETSASAGTAPIGYYELYDAVAVEFPEVRMLGQTPFVGYAVVDFAPEGEPDVSLDSGLVPGGAEEPEWFIAVASREPSELDAFSIVQLPAASVLPSGNDARDTEELRAARAAEARLTERLAETETELVAARKKTRSNEEAAAEREAKEAALAERDQRITTLEERVRAAEGRHARAEGELAEMRKTAAEAARKGATEAAKQLEGDGTRTAEAARKLEAVEARAAEAAKRVETAEARAAEAARKLEELETRAAEASKKLGAAEGRAAEASKKLEDAERARAASETRARDAEAAKAALEKHAKEFDLRLASGVKELEAVQARLARAEVQVKSLTDVADGGAPDDLAQLEALLKERAERVRKLEGDLREAERMGKELIRERTRPQPAPNGGGGPELARENAELRANVESLRWTLDEVEGRLARAGAPAPAPAR